MPAERRSGGATVCQDCHVSACSESDRLWPACHCQRLPGRDHHQRWRVVGLVHGVAGGLQSRKKNTARQAAGKPSSSPSPVPPLTPPSPSPSPVPPSPFPTLLRAACRQSTQASSSGGNSSMPALPLAWKLANRSPNVDRSHTHSRRGPSPAAGSHLPSSLIASHRVQACRRCQGRAISPLETFPFLLGASSSAASTPVPGHQTQTAGLEQTKLKQTRPSNPLDWSPLEGVTVIAWCFLTLPLVVLVFASPRRRKGGGGCDLPSSVGCAQQNKKSPFSSGLN